MFRDLFVTLFAALVFLVVSDAHAQNPQTVDACSDVRYLMARNATPHTLGRGGGDLQANSVVTGTLSNDSYADYWAFIATRPRGANNTAQSFEVTFNFQNTGEAILEYALFRGVLNILPYSTEVRRYTYQQGGDGAYTLVVRRKNVSDERVASYNLTLQTNAGGAITAGSNHLQSTPINNVANNRPLEPRPTFSNGVVDLPMSAAVSIHLDGTRLVNPRGGGLTQIYFPAEDFVSQNAFNMTLGNWARAIHYLAGDFSVVGQKDGKERLYYLQSFNYRVSLPGNSPNETDLLNVRYPDGTEIRLDWRIVGSIWVMDACIGFKLYDGRTFIGTSAPTDRRLIMSGNEDAFALSMNAIGANGTSTRHEVEMNWYGVLAESEIRLDRSTFTMVLSGQRDFAIQTTNMRFITERPFGDEASRLDVEMRDVGSSLTLDWVNMRGFTLANGVIDLNFDDGTRTRTQREGNNLLRFEALQDIIHMTYKDQQSGNNTIAGEQRLFLPASDSYLELITPAGVPTFDGRATPDQAEYIPRALNNLGGECYPSNTLLEMANCPPSGHPNPANGNLWLEFADLNALGGTIDLALMRSYNSRNHNVDSPFGYGWTTNFLLDYNISYDPVTNTRPVTPDVVRAYRVSLDVTYAPRGIVTFTTPSGSRHQFVANAPYTSGELRAITMPSWTLSRSELRAERWVLRQIGGLEYQFDRAGRLIQYGSRNENRFVTVDYPRTTLNGSAALNENQAVIITDTLIGENTQRRLELYYDDNHRIARAILRDMFLRDRDGQQMTAAPTDTCSPTNNCLEMRYNYSTDGYLIRVTHWSGKEALYTYNDGQMVGYDDPFAPITRTVRLSYHPDKGLNTMTAVLSNGTEEVFRQLELARVDNLANSDGADDLRLVSMRDELGNTRTFAYRYHVGSLRTPFVTSGQTSFSTFALVRQSSPLREAVDVFEARTPQEYTWDNGLLTRINARAFRDGQGRNGADIEYVNGQVAGIGRTLQGLPEWRASYDERGLLTRATYADASFETFAYDSAGRISTHTDTNGGIYQYDWSLSPQLVIVTRTNDGMVWEYAYNAVGLVREVRQYTPETITNAYEAVYGWDGLGRLVSVVDNVLGRHRMTHNLPENSTGEYLTSYVLDDPIGGQTNYVFDERGFLIQQSIEGSEGFLRLTRYSYDDYGRLTVEIKTLRDENGLSEISTRYSYSLAAFRPASTATPRETPIDGYQVVTILPSGRQQFRWYDGLGRLRRYVDENNRTSDYDYTIEQVDGDVGRFGERILQRSVLSGETVVLEGKYDFDVRRQLRYVELDDDPGEQDRIDYLWRLRTRDSTTRLFSMEPRVDGRTISLVEVLWEEYALGKTARIGTRQAVLPLISGFSVQNEHRPRLDWAYDFAGRLETMTDAVNRVTKTVYCPQLNGATRTVYGIEGDNRVDCNSTVFRTAITTDYHGRVIAVDDINGSVRIQYVADITNRQWRAVVTLTSADGQAVTWEMHFNGAGELVYWRDEGGIERTYAYDTLGYLRAVIVPNSPENSFTFTYTKTGLLTEVKDGLERGFAYSYNQIEQVVSELNRLTAEATSFAYNPSGLLTAVISPSGNATLFQYQDPVNAERLTSIIEPTGSQHNYSWNDEKNQIIYRNPFQHLTGYTFDGTGLLWRIDDALEARENPRLEFYPEGSIGRRSQEIHYDDAANITEWRWDVRIGNNTPSQWFKLNWTNANTLTIQESNTSNWSKQILFSPTGELLSYAGVVFEYTPTRQLNGIRVGDDLQWRIARQDQEPSLTLTDAFKAQTVMQYDDLYRLVSQMRGGRSSEYAYSVVENARGITVLNIDVDVLGEREVRFYEGNVRTGVPPKVEVRGFGQQMIYTYTPDKLLSQMELQVCSDGNIADIDLCFVCEDATQPDTPENCRRRQPIYDTFTTNLFYDQAQRPTRIVRNGEELQTFVYDDVGNLITYQDENGRTFRYGYDNANRLTSVITTTGVKLLMSYNTLDRVTGICRTRAEASNVYAECRNAGGEIETYAYDRLGNLTGRTLFGGNNNAISFSYSYSNGRLVGYGTTGNELRMSYDALGQLNGIVENGRNVSVSYYNLNQLAALDDMNFTYDEMQRLVGYSVSGRRFAFEYDVFGNAHTFKDLGNNASLVYEQSENGFLRTINPQGMFPEVWSAPDVRISGGDISLANGEIITNEFDKNGRVLTTFFSNPDFSEVFSLFLTTDLRNKLKRYALQLGANEEGVTAVYGYDGDERPFTLRVTDTTNLRVIFTQAYAYTNLGLRERETRQYADGTQVIFNYRYNGNSQIITSTTTIVRPSIVAGLGGITLGGFALGMVMVLWRRRQWVFIATFVLILGGMAMPLYAQLQREQTYNYAYDYDNRGNLTRMTHTDAREVCFEYGYDSLNRLISYKNGQVTRTYSYDLYGRPKTVDNLKLIYVGDSSQLYAIQNGNSDLRYFAQIDNQPSPFVVNANGDTTWLLNDGRYRALKTFKTGDIVRETWLFDSLGRSLNLESPTFETFEPCQAHKRQMPDDVVLRVLSLSDGTLWDAQTGLYFQRGRVYEPEIGRYLQVDSLGVDMLGNVYDSRERTSIPLLLEQQVPFIYEGIYRLREAYEFSRINERLTAEIVKAQYLPNLTVAFNPLKQALDTSKSAFNDNLLNMLSLPLWLGQNYSLPATYANASDGALRLPLSGYGQGGLNQLFDAPQNLNAPNWTQLLVASVQSPQATLGRFMETYSAPQTQLTKAYQPLRVAFNGHYFNTQQAPSWWGGNDTTPEDVVSRLPRTLLDVTTAAYALDVTQLLMQSSTVTVTDKVSEMLNYYLPRSPELPPLTLEQWQSQYFANDALGRERMLLPALPSPIRYTATFNEKWLLMPLRR